MPTLSLSNPPEIREFEPGAWKVRSKSHPEFAHTVRLLNGELTCTCPGGRFPKCWHRTTIQETYLHRTDVRKTMPTEKPAVVEDPADDDSILGPAPKLTVEPIEMPHAPSIKELHDFWTNA